MAEAFIYAAKRSAVAKLHGALANTRADDIVAAVIRDIIHPATSALVDDVILGCANQAGEDCRNIARLAALLAGIPCTVPGMTVNRLCGSGLQAVTCAAQAIHAGEGALFVAGGVENMSRSPDVMLKPRYANGDNPPVDSTIGWRFTNPRLPQDWTISFGETAEQVADRYHVSREAQDEYALNSHKRATTAIETGVFSDEIVAIETFERDQHPRPNLTPRALARLRPVFRQQGGSITAGNSSGLGDGAAVLLVGSSEMETQLGQRPMARILGTAIAGVEPNLMGLGPVPATRKLLKRLNLKVDQFDRIEVNEAFAAQIIPCIDELGLSRERVNVHGGAIALGYPLGCIGARLLVTLSHELCRIRGRYGLVAMCTSVGQGIAMAIEACR